MKTTAAYRVMCGQGGTADCYHGIAVTQNISGPWSEGRGVGSASVAPYLQYEAAWRSTESWQWYGAGVRRSF